jgi:hypothetical protein
MHEIYLLTLVNQRTRAELAPRTRADAVRDEQAFYEEHGPRLAAKPALRRLAVIPLALIAATAALAGLSHLIHG